MTQVFRCLSPVQTEDLPVDRGDQSHATLATFPSALALIEQANQALAATLARLQQSIATGFVTGKASAARIGTAARK